MCRNRALSLALFVIGVSAFVRGSDQNEILDRAGRAYYNLKSEGLLEFRCRVVPDWDALSTSVKTDAVGDALRPLLKQTHFDVSVGPDGASTVSRQSELAPPNEQLAQRLRQTATGVEQVLTGFFQTWSGFMLGFRGPERDKDYKMEEVDGQYRITQKQREFDVSFSLNQDLVTELTMAKPGYEITMHPRFSRHPISPAATRYLFTGYDSTIKITSGSIRTELVIENQQVEGFELPKTVTAMVGGIRILLHFEDYRIKKRI